MHMTLPLTGLGELRLLLKMIRRAVGIIPNVTVEVPAIPEDVQIMKESMLELADMGVKFLNLHQMRMTTYNCSLIVDLLLVRDTQKPYSRTTPYN